MAEAWMGAPSLFTTMYVCVAPQDTESSPMRNTAEVGYEDLKTTIDATVDRAKLS